MTYREKAEELLMSLLGANEYEAPAIVRLLEREGEYIPCVFKVLNAPRDVENWDTEIEDSFKNELNNESINEAEIEPLYIGRIEWLHTNGKVRELKEYETFEELKKVAEEELDYGVPISIILYSIKDKLCEEIVENSGCLPCSFEFENYCDRNTYLKCYLDEEYSFDDFYNLIWDIGNWDNINDRETIYQYINEKIRDGIYVSHILKVLEENPTIDIFAIWLGNSMETPWPVITKQDLINALSIDLKELDKIIVE
jgi:hypothetical protein